MITLAVEKRPEDGASAAVLRREGKVPAVVYGAHHEPTPVAIPLATFVKVLAQAGEATVVSLTGLGEAVPTLIHEVDLDPITNVPRHVDFYAVTKGEKVTVHVPLTFVGESPAVKAGANLVKVLHELEVEADPMKLPHDLVVDLAVLANINDQIHVRDIVLPAEVTMVTEADEVIAIAQEVAAEREEATAATIADIEIEKKGKEEAEVTESAE